jgi:transposase
VVIIGIDAHKRVHVAVAIDDAGRELGRWRGPNSTQGWKDLQEWAARQGNDRRWGIEGAWNYGRGLAQYLVAEGEAVHEVNPRWTAAGRRRARKAGKNDRLDARAVAILVRQEGTTLPRVTADDECAVLDLLVTERDGALAEATRLRNQIHQLLLQVDPEYRQHLPNLQSQAGLAVLESYTVSGDDSLQQQRAAAIRRLAQRLCLAVDQIKELTQQVRACAEQRFEGLTQICGINLLTAGALAGILGPGRPFATEAQLASYAGVAPLEASSADLVRHRLNRGGNRRLNAILYRIALTQTRYSLEARRYLERRQGEGKTRREALRALKRYIVRAIWRLWNQCQPAAGDEKLAAVA